MAEVVEHLPSKCEVLSLSPVLLKKKKEKNILERKQLNN
jgi:hypothetical protein